MSQAPERPQSALIGLKASWRRLPPSLRVLRAFLGATFVYAGLQKFLDPGFFHAGSPDFIGSQLHDFARGSPLRWALEIAASVPILAGLIVALGEAAIGIGTLLGVAPLGFAYCGFAVNLVLFLTATWHVHPYFLGSDSIYAVAWLAYALGLVGMRRAERRSLRSKPQRRPRRRDEPESFFERRDVLRAGVVTALSLFVAMAGFAIRRPPKVGALASTEPPTSTDPGPEGPADARSPAASASRHARPGRPIARLDQLPVGSALGFSDPRSGDPSVLLRPARDRVVAFSRVCTHAGCLVRYDSGNKILFCPCHGAEFDPADGARAISGPASEPLPRVDVAIDEASGQIVATRS
jgi:thiosulfate dehydrogenase (quinone) large subunit